MKVDYVNNADGTQTVREYQLVDGVWVLVFELTLD